MAYCDIENVNKMLSEKKYPEKITPKKLLLFSYKELSFIFWLSFFFLSLNIMRPGS
jgi:hypothetical protein